MTKEEMEKQIHDFTEMIYKIGYDDGLTEGIKNTYNKGLNDVWESIKKLGKLTIGEIYETFGDEYNNIYDIIFDYSPSDFIDAIKEYEDKQKQKLIANCITCKWDYRNYEKYLNVSEDEKVRHCNECYKNSGYELMSTEMKSCSILEDDCPYDIKCEECEVHCSVERAKQKLKGDKE